MANSRIYFKNEAGGTTVISRDTTSTSGNLVLPASGNVVSVDTAVTDNAIARYDSTTGKLQNSAITIDDSGNIGSGTQSFNGFGGSGFKNNIINGNFDIWQRGTSQTISGYGSVDRWNFINAGTSSRTISKVIATDTDRPYFNSPNILGITLTSLDATTSPRAIRHNQAIEDVTQLAGKTITLSFWARATNNTNIETTIQQVFGTGGSPSSAVITGAKRFSLTPQWTKFTTTVNVPSIVGKTLGTDGIHTSNTNVKFHLMSDSVNASNEGLTGTLTPTAGTIVFFAQVQLEEGSVATPFENRPAGLELSLCQRYYQKFITDGANGELYSHERVFVTSAGYTYVTKTIPFKVTMRTTPTVTIPRVFNQGTDYDTGWSVYASGLSSGNGGIAIYKATNTTANHAIAFNATASAEL